MASTHPVGLTGTPNDWTLKGKRFGRVVGSTYITWRKPSHWVKRYRGWGVQADVFETLERLGITEIAIDLGDHVLLSRMTDWQRQGIYDTLNQADGRQIFLEDVYFEVGRL
jgi:hypothetical protein